MTRAINVLAGLAFLATLSGQTPQAQPGPVSVPAEPRARERMDLDEVVCRNLREPTGSRLKKRRTERVCLTRREWEHRTLEAQMARRALDTGTCGGRCDGPN